MKAQVVAELAKTGMYTAAGSMGDLLADRMVEKIKAVKYYRSEGCHRLAEVELTDTTFGPKVMAIINSFLA